AGHFGKNLFTVGFQASTAPNSYPNMDLSNELRFLGDLTGDGRVDMFFTCWSGQGVMCANRGAVTGADWSGPGYTCYGTTDALAYADVNGDGKIDVLALDLSGGTDDITYKAYYAQVGPYLWRLNNGDPNITTWQTTSNFINLRVTDPHAAAAPF